MPLREGSSDKVVQENIKCILDKDGCGYDPPYKDPARDEYTPAQAAAIAYAKAGRRNNTGKKTSASKKTKSVKTQEIKTPEAKKEEPKSPAQSAKPETETDKKQPGSDIQVPEGWKVQQPGGDTDTSKKNQPPKKGGEEELSPEADKQMLDEVMEGYKMKWGDGASLLSDAWDTYNPKQKKKFLANAKKIKAEEQAKQSKEDNKAKAQPPAPALTPASTPEPKTAPAPAPITPKEQTPQPQQPTSSSTPPEDKYEKLYQDNKDLLEEAYGTEKTDAKGVWDLLSNNTKQYLLDTAPKVIEEKKKNQAPPQTPQPQVADGWKSKDDGWTSHLKPKFDDSGNITYQGKIYKPTKTLPGSTNPKLYTDEQGTPKFVVKEGGAEGQNDAEYAANQVYGILAPHLPTSAIKSRLIDGKLVNDFMPNSKTISDLSDEEFNGNEVLGKVKGSLVADALVANWDYMGLSNDNMMMDNKGRILRIDSGGTFNYRAQGASKEFGAVPMEMWTLRSSDQGKQLWDYAEEEDYKNIWLRQMDALASESDKLKKTIATSNLAPEVKDAFAKRVDILTIAGQEARDIAKRPKMSWKGVDQVMERAFRYASLMDSKDPNWADRVRNKIRDDLNKAFPETPSKFNLNSGVIQPHVYPELVKLFNYRLSANEPGWEDFKDASEDEKYSVYSYTGGGYEKLNKYLRADIYESDRHKEYYETKAEALQGLLERLPSDTSLLHRMNSIQSDNQDLIDLFKGLRPGDEFEPQGFDSYTQDDSGGIMDTFASMSPSNSFFFITQYQGKNAKHVDPVSATPGEGESILQKKSNLRVVKTQVVPVSNFPKLDEGSVGGANTILMITYEDA